MTVYFYNFKLQNLYRFLFLIFLSLYTLNAYSQTQENSNEPNLSLSKESYPNAQNQPVTGTNNPVYVTCPKPGKHLPVNPVKSVDSQMINNQFKDKELQSKYEETLYKYETWRLKFMQELHIEQYKFTKLYGNFLFYSLIGIFVLLVINIFVGFYKNEKDSVFVSFTEGSIQLKMNTLLFVLIMILLFLYHYYFTTIYPIN